MRSLPLLLAVLGTALVLPMAGASSAVQTVDLVRSEEDCAAAAIPCGPIPVIVTMQLGDTKNLEFPESGEIALEGKLVYYFDVDNDGYGHDQTNKPVVTFSTPRGVPWVDISVEPAEVQIPVDDPTYISQTDPNDPGQYHYEYTHPITVTLTKNADPTAEELEEHIRAGDQYRVLVAAMSTGSQVNAGGTTYGHMEGYGVKDIRISASSASDDDDGAGQSDEGGLAPGFGTVTALAGLGAAVATSAVRRRRA